MIIRYLNFATVTLLLSILFSLPTYAENSDTLTVDDFLTDANLLSVDISPDDKYLAGVWRQGAQYCVLVRELAVRNLPIVGQMCGDVIRAVQVKWANNERLLVELSVPYNLKKAKRSRNLQDFSIKEFATYRKVVSVNTKAEDLIYLKGNKKHEALGSLRFSNIQNMLVNDSDHILMVLPHYIFPSWRNTLYKINTFTGQAEIAAKGGKFTGRFITNNAGLPLYRVDHYALARKTTILQFLGNGEWQEVKSLRAKFADNESISFSSFGVDDANRVIYRRPNPVTGFYELVHRQDDKEEVIVKLAKQDVFAPLNFDHSQQLAGYIVETDIFRRYFFDAETQSLYDDIASQFPEQNFSTSNLNPQRRYFIVKNYGPNNPGIYYIYDSKSKSLITLQTAYKELNHTKLATSILIDYPTQDGILLRAYGLLPPEYEENKKYPMVIMPHGGPHSRDRATYDDFAQFIATRGYIVIKPNFRGSTGYGLKFEQMGYKQWGGLMQDDLTDAVNFMVKQGYADKNKICIVGASYGGYAALMGTVKTPDLYQCAVSINGVTDLKKQIEYDLKEGKGYEDEVRAYTDKAIGHLTEDSHLLAEKSPTLQADKIKVPLLLVASAKDNIVSRQQTRMLIKQLNKKNKEYEYLRLKKADHHVFTYIDHTEEIYQKVESFLKKYLQ